MYLVANFIVRCSCNPESLLAKQPFYRHIMDDASGRTFFFPLCQNFGRIIRLDENCRKSDGLMLLGYSPTRIILFSCVLFFPRTFKRIEVVPASTVISNLVKIRRLFGTLIADNWTSETYCEKIELAGNVPDRQSL